MKNLKLLLLFVIVFTMTDCTHAVSETQERECEEVNGIMPFKLYPTGNIWNFLKLDTRNGKIWQVQFSVESEEYRYELPLNPVSLSSNWKETGRFELYPTQNLYNFILLDAIDGKMWQVQWSTEPENRGIIPIPQSGNTL